MISQNYSQDTKKDNSMRYKNRRFKEAETQEEIYDKTISKVEDDLKALQSLSMADYEEKDDPEIDNDYLTDGISDAVQLESDEVFTESQKARAVNRVMREAFMFEPVLEQYYADTGKDAETFDFQEFFDNYIPDDHRFKKYPKQLTQFLQKNYPEIKDNNYLSKAGSHGKKEEPMYKANGEFQVSEMTAKFADLYQQASETTLTDAAESCQEKYDLLYDTTRSIIMGRATLPHAFLCGDAGIGKCSTRLTFLKVRVPENIAQEIKEFSKNWK